ncbi:hypothetical protein ACHAWF_017142 [Thalassiosira exigua]
MGDDVAGEAMGGEKEDCGSSRCTDVATYATPAVSGTATSPQSPPSLMGVGEGTDGADPMESGDGSLEGALAQPSSVCASARPPEIPRVGPDAPVEVEAPPAQRGTNVASTSREGPTILARGATSSRCDATSSRSLSITEEQASTHLVATSACPTQQPEKQAVNASEPERSLQEAAITVVETEAMDSFVQRSGNGVPSAGYGSRDTDQQQQPWLNEGQQLQPQHMAHQTRQDSQQPTHQRSQGRAHQQQQAQQQQLMEQTQLQHAQHTQEAMDEQPEGQTLQQHHHHEHQQHLQQQLRQSSLQQQPQGQQQRLREVKMKQQQQQTQQRPVTLVDTPQAQGGENGVTSCKPPTLSACNATSLSQCEDRAPDGSVIIAEEQVAPILVAAGACPPTQQPEKQGEHVADSERSLPEAAATVVETEVMDASGRRRGGCTPSLGHRPHVADLKMQQQPCQNEERQLQLHRLINHTQQDVQQATHERAQGLTQPHQQAQHHQLIQQTQKHYTQQTTHQQIDGEQLQQRLEQQQQQSRQSSVQQQPQGQSHQRLQERQPEQQHQKTQHQQREEKTQTKRGQQLQQLTRQRSQEHHHQKQPQRNRQPLPQTVQPAKQQTTPRQQPQGRQQQQYKGKLLPPNQQQPSTLQTQQQTKGQQEQQQIKMNQQHQLQMKERQMQQQQQQLNGQQEQIKRRQQQQQIQRSETEKQTQLPQGANLARREELLGRRQTAMEQEALRLERKVKQLREEAAKLEALRRPLQGAREAAVNHSEDAAGVYGNYLPRQSMVDSTARRTVSVERQGDQNRNSAHAKQPVQLPSTVSDVESRPATKQASRNHDSSLPQKMLTSDQLCSTPPADARGIEIQPMERDDSIGSDEGQPMDSYQTAPISSIIEPQLPDNDEHITSFDLSHQSTVEEDNKHLQAPPEQDGAVLMDIASVPVSETQHKNIVLPPAVWNSSPVEERGDLNHSFSLLERSPLTTPVINHGLPEADATVSAIENQSTSLEEENINLVAHSKDIDAVPTLLDDDSAHLQAYLLKLPKATSIEDHFRDVENQTVLKDSHQNFELSPPEKTPFLPRRIVQGETKTNGITRRRWAHRTTTEGANLSPHRYDDEDNRDIPERTSRVLRAPVTGEGDQEVNARIVFRKVVTAVLANPDDEILDRDDTETILIIVTLLKEAILGILLAFAALSLVLFLDHRFLLGLHTARNFRKATFHLMNDPETLKTFEEDAGIKFMHEQEYTAIIEEVAKTTKELENEAKALEAWRQDYEDLLREYREVNGWVLDNQPKLELDRFCEQCWWSLDPKIKCGGRVALLWETYSTNKFAARLDAMKRKSCRKSDEAMKEEEKRKAKQDVLLADWDNKKAEFCGYCSWNDGGITCTKKVERLLVQDNILRERGMAKLMIEAPQCTETYRAAEDAKLDNFCMECEWGDKLTCKQRVKYLIYTYKNTKHNAMLSALGKPQCASKE